MRIAALLLIGLGPALPAFAGDWPAWFLRVPASVSTLLVADTANATLYEYSVDGTDDINVAAHYMSIGQNGAGKSRAGDRRTPLGVYFITEQLDTSRLHEKYGVTAFPLDYPNAIDRLAGRTGDGIWLHGVIPGPGRRPEFDTDGCIALPNEDLGVLAGRIELLETPIVVTRQMEYVDPAARDEAADALAERVSAWRAAQNSPDLLAYLALYANDFRYRGLSRDAWAGFRTRQFLAGEPGGPFDLEDLFILRDPEDSTLFMTRFLKRREGSSAVQKRLYWRLDADGVYRIVAEDNG